MHFARPAFVTDPRRFGRGPARFAALAAPLPAPAPALGDDVKLFAATFAAGFLFVSCLIA